MVYSGHTSRQSLRPLAQEHGKKVYGKKPTKPLSVTGDQFLRSNDIFSIPSDVPETGAHLERHGTHDEEPAPDSEDSPLSDAEPRDPVYSSHFATEELTRHPARNNAQPSRHRVESEFSKITRAHIQEAAAKSQKRLHPRVEKNSSTVVKEARNVSQHRVDKAHGHKTVKPMREAPRRKRRLPANELLLVPALDQDEDAATTGKNERAILQRDPISSFAIALLDTVSSDDIVAQDKPRKRKSPLTSIRKRLKTPTPAQKSFKTLRQSHSPHPRTFTMRSPAPILGDGFEASELHFNIRSSLKRRRQRPQKRQQPFWEGLQALSLTSGLLPEVFFDEPNGTLKVEKPSERNGTLAFSEGTDPFAADAGSPSAAQLSGGIHSSKRRVNFSDKAFVELSSVSAPRRRYDSSDNESEDGDEEAADTYVDGQEMDAGEVVDEDEPVLSDEDRETRASSRHASPSPEPHTPRSYSPPAPRHRPVADTQSISSGVTLDFRKQGIPGTLRRLRSNKSSLVELRELIEDDYEPDDEQEMLLESEPPTHEVLAVQRDTSVIPQSTRAREWALSLTYGQGTDSFPCQLPTGTPRSILKKSHQVVPNSSDSTRSRNTASNTRRNSTIAIDEQSHYFTSATSQLDTSQPPRCIIRLRSNQPRVQIPYSGYTVPETSPEPPDHTNATQLHLLRQNQEAAWTSERRSAPPRDLRSLTRTVSQEHGTLSQAVRRRRSMPFQSPTKAR